MADTFIATCSCGAKFSASWYRLDSVGPKCDKCLERKKREREFSVGTPVRFSVGEPAVVTGTGVVTDVLRDDLGDHYLLGAVKCTDPRLLVHCVDGNLWVHAEELELDDAASIA